MARCDGQGMPGTQYHFTLRLINAENVNTAEKKNLKLCVLGAFYVNNVLETRITKTVVIPNLRGRSQGSPITYVIYIF